jgi:hypothetical protein
MIGVLREGSSLRLIFLNLIIGISEALVVNADLSVSYSFENQKVSSLNREVYLLSMTCKLWI